MPRWLVPLLVLCGCVSTPAPVPEAPVESPPQVPESQAPATPAASSPSPNDPPEVAEVCGRAACRFVEAMGHRMPYAHDTDVVIAKGETFSLTGTERDGLLTRLRHLADPKAPGPRLTVSWQVGRARPDVFSVTNGFPRRLRYRAMILTPRSGEFEDIDSCAVGKGKTDVAAVPPSEVKLIAMIELELVGEDAFDGCEKRFP